MFKKALVLASLLAFVLAIGIAGCGGGGGGGGGGGNGTTNAGDTAADPGSTIVGRVVNHVSGAGVGGIRVFFYNAGGTIVGQATTRVTGWFDTAIGANAVRFHVDKTSINTVSFNNAYIYNSLGYSTLIPTCTAPLPLIEVGVQKQLPQLVRLSPSNQLPPAPTGCP